MVTERSTETKIETSGGSPVEALPPWIRVGAGHVAEPGGPKGRGRASGPHRGTLGECGRWCFYVSCRIRLPGGVFSIVAPKRRIQGGGSSGRRMPSQNHQFALERRRLLSPLSAAPTLKITRTCTKGPVAVSSGLGNRGSNPFWPESTTPETSVPRSPDQWHGEAPPPPHYPEPAA